MRTKDTESNATTDTYKTYDDKDRLYQVIPPDANTTDAGLIFTNLYYPNDLLWQKKVPDRDWEEFRYNKRDLLAYRQDGYLKDKSQWMANQYDPYGRLTRQGFYNSAPAASNSFDAAIVSEVLLDNTYGTGGIEKDKLVKSEAQLLGTTGSITRNLGYDACGRQNHVTGNTIKSLADLTAYELITVYDDADHIINSTEAIGGATALTILSSSDYDHAGRQIADYIKVNNLTQQKISASTYTPKDQLETLKLGNNLQTINYGYFNNGFLESINNPSSLGNDLWAMELGYDASTTASTPGTELRKDGNITSAHWKVAGQSKQAMNYTYNYQSFLTAADYFESSNNGRYSTTYSYNDKRGNFSNIMRMGMMDGTAGQIDNLNFTYYPGSNQIKSISDGGTVNVKEGGYKSLTGDYMYNDNGAMDHDPSRSANFTMNHLDLPDEIAIPDSSGSIQYLYDAAGGYHGQLEIRDGKQVASRYHIGSVEYEDGIVDQIMTSQGYVELEYNVPTHVFRTGIEPNTTQQGISVKSEASVINNRTVIYKGGQYVWLDEEFTVNIGGDFEAWIKDFPPTSFSQRFIIKDHLGSARIIFSDSDKNGSVNSSEIINRFEYYPFGSLWEGDWNGDYKYNHLFTGQERQKRFGLGYDRFRYRISDPLLGRFLSVDPLSSDYAWVNGYNSTENEPVGNIDLHGLQKVNFMKALNNLRQGFNNTFGTNVPMSSNQPQKPIRHGRVDITVGGNVQAGAGVGINATGPFGIQAVFEADAGSFKLIEGEVGTKNSIDVISSEKYSIERGASIGAGVTKSIGVGAGIEQNQQFESGKLISDEIEGQIGVTIGDKTAIGISTGKEQSGGDIRKHEFSIGFGLQFILGVDANFNVTLTTSTNKENLKDN